MHTNPGHRASWLAGVLALMASTHASAQATVAQPLVSGRAPARVLAPAQANPGAAQVSEEQRQWVADLFRRHPDMDAKQLDADARQRYTGLSEASYAYLVRYATELYAGDLTEQRKREQKLQRELEAQRRALAQKTAQEQGDTADAEVPPGPADAPADPVQALSPGLRGWVMAQARTIVDRGLRPDPERIAGRARVRLRGQDYRDADIDALVQLVLMESSRQANADLRDAMERMRTDDARKARLREGVEALKDRKDALSEQDEQQQLRLQSALDRRAKFLDTLSEVMKKSSDASASIKADLK